MLLNSTIIQNIYKLLLFSDSMPTDDLEQIDIFDRYKDFVKTSVILECVTLEHIRPFLPYLADNDSCERFLRSTLQGMNNPSRLVGGTWKGKDIPAVYVAMPPLLVHNGFRVLEVRYDVERQWLTAYYNHESGRCKDAYLYSGIEGLLNPALDNKMKKVLFKETAAAYAQQHWWDFENSRHPLRQDTWADFIRIDFRNIDGRTKVLDDGSILGQPAVYAVMTRPLHEIILNTKKGISRVEATRLVSESINLAIIEDLITMDNGIGWEMKGARKGHYFSNCMHCGSGLLEKRCQRCGTEFEDLLSVPWACAPPQKIVNFLAKEKYVVPHDIRLARLGERVATHTTGPIPSLEPKIRKT